MISKGKTLFIFFICIGVLTSPMISALNFTFEESDYILEEITTTPEKYLYKDEKFGDIYVQYWIHAIDGITIKNDYMLLQKNPDDEIIRFVKEWIDIENCDIDFSKIKFDPSVIGSSQIFWKKRVMFPEENDCKNFYSFESSQSFPLFCWEVRHNDGTTVMYDLDGEVIGNGIPAPYDGFTMSGFHEPDYPDPWLNWRLNAKSWYENWCDSTVGISFPTPATISSYISNPEYELFFEIAHGGSTYYKATETEYYYSSDVTDAMSDRQPIRFAFIGSCGGMDSTGPGTWSNEFRKGSVYDTVVVGYTGMGSCPGWSVSLEWKDTMFYAMYSGETIEDAFNFACAQYPTIADCVVFTGDPTLKVYEPENDEDPDIDFRPPNVIIINPVDNSFVYRNITITGSAVDIDGTVSKVYIKIDNGDWKKAKGTNSWEYSIDTSLLENGYHEIRAIAVDDDGMQSGTDLIGITVSNLPLYMEMTAPDGGYVNEPVQCFGYVNGGIPPYCWNWSFGDGSYSIEKHPMHCYQNLGEYTIQVTLKDTENTTIIKKATIFINEHDKTPPEITIIQPSNDIYIQNQKIASFFSPIIIGPIDIKIEVNDYESGIKNVSVFINDEIFSPLVSNEYTWIWDEEFFGKFIIRVEAKDKVGNKNQAEISGWKFF